MQKFAFILFAHLVAELITSVSTLNPAWRVNYYLHDAQHVRGLETRE